jgi:hypothetical protein
MHRDIRVLERIVIRLQMASSNSMARLRLKSLAHRSAAARTWRPSLEMRLLNLMSLSGDHVLYRFDRPPSAGDRYFEAAVYRMAISTHLVAAQEGQGPGRIVNSVMPRR